MFALVTALAAICVALWMGRQVDYAMGLFTGFFLGFAIGVFWSTRRWWRRFEAFARANHPRRNGA